MASLMNIPYRTYEAINEDRKLVWKDEIDVFAMLKQCALGLILEHDCTCLDKEY